MTSVYQFDGSAASGVLALDVLSATCRTQSTPPGPSSIELWQASLNVSREGNYLGYGKDPAEAILDAWRMRARRFAGAI